MSRDDRLFSRRQITSGGHTNLTGGENLPVMALEAIKLFAAKNETAFDAAVPVS